MKLLLKNFAKIKEADIQLDGLTVIAGDNNTGKSTLGKVLFTLFHSLRNMSQSVVAERKEFVLQFLWELYLNDEYRKLRPPSVARRMAKSREVVDIQLSHGIKHC